MRIAQARASASGSRRPTGTSRSGSFSETEPAGTAEIEIGYGNGMPSRLVLPEVPVGDVPDQLPPCPGLRGEPCRDYVPFENDTPSSTAIRDRRELRRSASPLVPAFAECTAPNRTHGAPLASPSCSPPSQGSNQLAVGTPDANGKAAQSTGSLRGDVIVGDPSTSADESDVALSLQLTDVRRRSDLGDYTGELEASTVVRITDGANGAGKSPGTVEDFTYAFTIPCSETADEAIGSTCSASTTADALVPNTIQEGERAVWELGQVVVNDGGADGLASTSAGNAPFARQGIFVP